MTKKVASFFSRKRSDVPGDGPTFFSNKVLLRVNPALGESLSEQACDICACVRDTFINLFTI